MFKRVSSPEEAGVSSRGLLDFIDEVERRGIEIHSFILLRHGREVCRANWQPYSVDRPHMLFSLSKSFTSCAAGFAVAEGRLDYDTRVADVLRDKLPARPSERLMRITLGDLLCMGSGLDPASDSVPPMAADWCKHVLSYDIKHEPGAHFDYNSFGSYLCSAMVTRATGQTCCDYLYPRMFEKIGIKKPVWDVSPQGINCGGWGLHLSCEDIAKFGQLLLQKGMWSGARVLPEGWTELASAAHIDNSGRNAHADWEQGYGYQFWRCRDGRYRGDGMCGQLCIVSEREDAVLAMTAGTNDMGAQMDAVHDLLLAAIDAEPASKADRQALSARIGALEYKFPNDDASGHDISGTYESADGCRLKFEHRGDLLLMTCSYPGGRALSPMQYRCGQPYESIFKIQSPGAPRERGLGGFGWHKGVLRLVMRLPDGPFTRCDEMRFSDNDNFWDNVWGAGFVQGSHKFKRIK